MNFDWTQFFSNLDTQASLIFIAFCLGAFLIGLLMGYALRAGTVRRLRKAVKQSEAELKAKDAQITKLQEELDLKDADLKKADYELAEVRAAADRFEAEKSNLNREVYQLRSEIDKVNSSSETYLATIEDLNDQILGLKTRNNELLVQLENLPSSPVSDTPPPADENTAKRLALVEARLNLLEQENDELRHSLDSIQLHSTSETTSTGQPVGRGDVLRPTEERLQEPEPNIDLIISPNRDILASDRSLLRQQDKDDLTRIEGLGPFLEKKLNDIGITSFEQISQWTIADIQRVTQQIQYFEGRIEKDDWVGQARKLVASGGAPGENGTGDDLKVVEGIGPKIEAILKKAGITTLEALAKSDPEDLSLLLEKTDARYRIQDPTTWPAQARLAANGDWDVLKDYQDQLKGGKDIDL